MKTKILLISLLIVGVISLNWYFPTREYLQGAVEWSQDQGHWSILLFYLIYVLCGLFFVPVGPLIMVAGTIFGFWFGYLVVAVSAMTAVAVCFALGKKLWRHKVEKLRHSNPRYEAIFEAISKHGALLVFLIRSNPVLPFSLLNYLFTIPKLDTRRYFLSTLAGMTPDIMLYLYIGRMGQGWLDDSQGLTVWNWVILGLAIATTLVAGYIIQRLIHQAVHPKGAAPPT